MLQMSTGLLLSGGMDSVALAYWKRPAFAYTINYGQSAFEGELRAAQAVSAALSLTHHVVIADCSALGSGDMAGKAKSTHAPVPEWWPYRNQLIVTLAAMRAIEDGVKELLVGTVRSDGVHADGKLDFYEKLDALVSMQEGNVRIHVPAISMSTVELVRTSGIPFEMLTWAHSCHVAQFACGQCRGCVKHAESMKALGYGDY